MGQCQTQLLVVSKIIYYKSTFLQIVLTGSANASQSQLVEVSSCRASNVLRPQQTVAVEIVVTIVWVGEKPGSLTVE